MTAERAAHFMERFKKEEKLLGPNERAAIDFVLAMLAAPAAPAPVPLTDAQIYAIWPTETWAFAQESVDFVRAIERAHGIGAVSKGEQA